MQQLTENNPQTSENIQKNWDRISKKFQFSQGLGAYTSWIKPLNIVSIDNGIVTISAPSKFIKDWVTNNFNSILEEYLSEEIPSFKGFNIKIDASTNFLRTEDHIEAGKNDLNAPANHNKESTQGYSFEAKTDEKFSFNNFISNDTNKFALNAARSISNIENQNYGLFRSLYIQGSQGNGKTHLLQSIANEINNNPKDKRKAIYLSAEKFMYGFIKSLQEKNIINFKEYIRSADVLLIDDIQFICGKKNIQEEFLHSFNAITESGSVVILSADRQPEKLKDIDERLKARICAGITADIKKPDLNLRLAFLKEKIKTMKLDISDDISSFLANNITSSIREVEGALNRIIAKSTLSEMEITLENSITWINDMISVNSHEISINNIKKIVCENFNLRINEIESKTKSRQIVRPRQIAIYLAKKLTTKSLPEIGRNFGGRDHATVIHSIKSIEKSIIDDAELKDLVDDLQSTIQG